MVGSTKDPADGKAVAGSVFAAVIVYVVRYTSSLSPSLLQPLIKRVIPQAAAGKLILTIAIHRSSSSSAAFKHTYTYGRVGGAR